LLISLTILLTDYVIDGRRFVFNLNTEKVCTYKDTIEKNPLLNWNRLSI